MIQEDNIDGACYIFLIGTQISGPVYIQIFNSLQYVGTATDGKCDVLYFYAPRVFYNYSKNSNTYGVCDTEKLQQLYNVLSESVMENHQYGSRTISGKVNVKNDGLLYLAMPALPGFKAYVDGNEQEIKNFLDGIAIDLQPGEHIIELKYTPQGMWSGIIITAIFLLILVVYCIYKKVILNEKTDNR